MERLTEKISNGTKPKTLRGLIRWFVTHNGIRKDVIIGEYNKLYDRLVEYEDLGVPPEQLQEILANNLDPIEMCKVSIALDKLKEYQEAEKQGLLLRLPCEIGNTVYVLAECEMINTVLDGTYETATGYYCPYELNGKCPHDTDDCKKCQEKTAVFEDTVRMFAYDGDELTIMTEICNVFGPLGRYIFLTREEAEAKLTEIEELNNG